MSEDKQVDDKRDRLIRLLARMCVENEAWIIGLKQLLVSKGKITEEEFLAYRTAALMAATTLAAEQAAQSRSQEILELLANFEGPVQ